MLYLCFRLTRERDRYLLFQGYAVGNRIVPIYNLPLFLNRGNGKLQFCKFLPRHKNRRLKTGAYEDFKSDFISREEYKAFTAQFDQQIKEASDTIMRLTSERNSVMGGLAEQQSWLEQFRKYANIKELTRSTVVNLIDYIHIRENKDIDVGLMHCDRFASIVEFLRERQEKEDANKVIRFERKVV